jgi:hypothetical protein
MQKRLWGTDGLVEHWSLLPRETELLTNNTGTTRSFAVLMKGKQSQSFPELNFLKVVA